MNIECKFLYVYLKRYIFLIIFLSFLIKSISKQVLDEYEVRLFIELMDLLYSLILVYYILGNMESHITLVMHSKSRFYIMRVVVIILLTILTKHSLLNLVYIGLGSILVHVNKVVVFIVLVVHIWLRSQENQYIMDLLNPMFQNDYIYGIVLMVLLNVIGFIIYMRKDVIYS